MQNLCALRFITPSSFTVLLHTRWQLKQLFSRCMLSNWYEYRCQNTPAYTPNTSTNTLPILWLQTRCWFNTQLTQKQNATSIKIEINLKVSAMESVCNLLFFDPLLSSLADGLACIWHGKALNLDYIFLRDFSFRITGTRARWMTLRKEQLPSGWNTRW